MSKVILTTDRLLMRQLTLADAAFVLELLNTPTYLKFIGDKNVRSIEDAKSHLKKDRIGSYKANGFGLWLVVLKESNKPIGTCGLIKRDAFADVDIGFAFLPKFLGKGYGYEAARATLTFAYEELKMDRVIAFVNQDNKASIALLEKLGLTFEKQVEISEGDVVQLFSPIKKPD